ncbi:MULTISPECIES: class I SAM-dependent methyltransferase [Bacillus]|uniref:class I SAM-dependent methyltransferase n=1 Tax=Bacillus TaxID=1386 RepID=UPI003872C971
MWNEKADFWNENSENMWLKGSRKTIIPFIIENVTKETTILDAGCGDGFGTFLLASVGLRATGVDIAEKMIEKAQLERNHPNAHFIKGDLTSLPFEDASFDSIMAINSIEWTESPLVALHEMKRVLKPNGHLFLGLLGPTAGPRANSYSRLYGKDVICNTMMPWEFEQLAVENGWKLLEGLPVYKEEAKKVEVNRLPRHLKQALTFMWVFHLEKGEK